MLFGRSSDNLNFSGELVVEKELLPRSAEDLDPEPSFANDFSTGKWYCTPEVGHKYW